MRPVSHRYEDPLDRVWLDAARRIGLRVTRTEHAYASTDGDGTLAIGVEATLDDDDCLAQMILHELCHSLVEGPESFERPDWGLDNETARDLDREHACLRLQAWITGRHGLRRVLAPTTDHRAFYDALGPDPLDGDEPSVVLARRAAARTDRDPWAPHLGAALEATAQIARAVPGAPGSLWELVEPSRPKHPAGGWRHPAPEGRRCGGCAWRFVGGPGRPKTRCAARGRARVDDDWPGCERHVAAVECEPCGACCREAYDRVELGPREPVAKAHPELLTREGGRLAIVRVRGRCPALADGPGYRCRIYPERPRSCREFTRGSASCFVARRRVGLSP